MASQLRCDSGEPRGRLVPGTECMSSGEAAGRDAPWVENEELVFQVVDVFFGWVMGSFDWFSWVLLVQKQ